MSELLKERESHLIDRINHVRARLEAKGIEVPMPSVFKASYSIKLGRCKLVVDEIDYEVWERCEGGRYCLNDRTLDADDAARRLISEWLHEMVYSA